MWKSRNAKTAEEGIRNERTTNQLSSVLAKAEDNLNGPGREYAARTITGLINALAEEVTDLKVEVKTQPDSPFWRKQIDAIKIDFSRLAFKPLKLGGSVGISDPAQAAASNSLSVNSSELFSDLACIDTVFDQIDADKSGALDSDEIAQALNLATLVSAVDQVKHEDVIKNLASDLVKLYDFNGDGVVDRHEYRSLVADMAALRKSRESTTEEDTKSQSQSKEGFVATAKRITGDFISSLVWRLGIAGKKDAPIDKDNIMLKETVRNTENSTDTQTEVHREVTRHSLNDHKAIRMRENVFPLGEKVVNLTDSPDIEKIAQGVGSITLSDLKLDLRRLFFGAIPLLKRITPGGPLVLEPFTVTIDGSFSREDIMDSFLLDAGLRRLVAMALRRRVGSLRDFLEGALFHGRSWKLNSESGPSVNVPKLTNVEFDSENRLIITGRARVQSNKDAPVIENAFKVRTKIGTRKGGKVIRLVEPELALVLECPKAFEENLSKLCSALNLPQPPRPKPIYSFFPIYSPFKVDDNDGFDLGEDNSINSIYIQDGALHFQLGAVLRPGRFLGSHYIAFTVPIRTFIVTLDRVREGMRAARQAKNAAKDGKVVKREKVRTKIEQAIDAELSRTSDRNTTKRGQPPKSFFSRFVDGYLQAERDFSDKARLTQAIGDFFGRQGIASRKTSLANENSQENRNETKSI
ncbi:hypothetical protein FisN_8Lh266 [Fistulifera solaris]|uniref:EF-hand domain-containing protein n=1 Tax=Fistulifera solaris TaxID=1519565 RepID=A0A1Z5JN48_FISSO|nr:hypothetical protein FisN_8Lh266 [Fistulifera solaris]|eukprot:GAX15435.1 hypothetical protein FisN_8Lh266 [Fistulifera solaris]